MYRSCFFYITDRPDYADEARASAESVRRNMLSDVGTYLFTPNKHISSDGFSDAIYLSNRKHEQWFLDQTRYMTEALDVLQQLGFRRVCYLDCDTFICTPVYELFDMLDNYDILGAHAPGRQTTKSFHKLPPSFPEMNIGVNPMRSQESMKVFWKIAYEQYAARIDLYGNNDQGVLRDMLWGYTPAYSFYILPPEYNLRFNFPCFVSGDVKILHGHGASQSVADQINANRGMRTWHQNHLYTV